jgi:hypothetical protein
MIQNPELDKKSEKQRDTLQELITEVYPKFDRRTNGANKLIFWFCLK